MIPAEVKQVLSYAASVDTWMRATDADAAALMLAGWTDLLHDVTLDVAMAGARAHYSTSQPRSLTPGDLLDYARDLRRDQHREQVQEQRRELANADGDVSLLGDVSGAEYLRDLTAAVAAGAEPPPMPAGLPRATKAADVWERRCQYHELCACDHTTCRDGWADDEVTVINGQRKTYPAVERCRFCKDALLMAEEKGIAKKPSRHTARR